MSGVTYNNNNNSNNSNSPHHQHTNNNNTSHSNHNYNSDGSSSLQTNLRIWKINDNLTFTLPITYGPMFFPEPYQNQVRLIGQGAYGCVVAAHDYSNGVDASGKPIRPPVAIKKVPDFASRELAFLKRTMREIIILNIFRGHPHIVELMDMFIIGNDLYIVMNMLNSDLMLDIAHGCKKGLRYHPDKTRQILYGVLKGVDFLSKSNIVHRDLKPGNILLGKDKVQLCDFGMSNAQHLGKKDIPMDSTYVVTRMYRPPEVILESARQTCAIDMFSIGCIFAEMLFAEQNPSQDRRLFNASSDCSRRVGGQLLHLKLMFDVCGTPDVDDLDCSENAKLILVNTDWFKHKKEPTDWSKLFPSSKPEAIDLLKRMLHFNPDKRCTAQEALSSSYFNGFRSPFPVDSRECVDTTKFMEFANSIDNYSLQQIVGWFKQQVNPFHSHYQQ